MLSKHMVVRRKMLITACTLAMGYLLLALALTACQRKLLYHPTRYPAGAADKVAAGHRLRPWLNARGEKIGWHRPLSNGVARAKVLVVHGNAGSALDRLDFADGLQSVEPVDVFILEYPGYGDRPGVASQESILKAAGEGLELLTNTGPVFVVGESLGTGVASYLAGTYPGAVRGVMLFCPYNNLAAVAQHHMSLFPVGWILRDRFPSEEWLKNYRGPVGILVMENDQIVPARFGRQLYEGYAGPKKLWVVNDGGHNDACTRPSLWWGELSAFWGAAW
jgi:uncharacterized protein